MVNGGTFLRGETVTLFYGVDAGLEHVVGLPTAELKRVARASAGAPGPDVASCGSLIVTAAAPTPPRPAGWHVTVLDALTATLAPGLYATDLKLALGGGVHKTETLMFRLVNAVTQ